MPHLPHRIELPKKQLLGLSMREKVQKHYRDLVFDLVPSWLTVNGFRLNLEKWIKHVCGGITFIVVPYTNSHTIPITWDIKT